MCGYITSEHPITKDIYAIIIIIKPNYNAIFRKKVAFTTYAVSTKRTTGQKKLDSGGFDDVWLVGLMGLVVDGPCESQIGLRFQMIIFCVHLLEKIWRGLVLSGRR